LPKPDLPPALPPVPTSSQLEDFDRENEQTRKAQHMENFWATFRALNPKKEPTPTPPARPDSTSKSEPPR
jgi:hypothetical protein